MRKGATRAVVVCVVLTLVGSAAYADPTASELQAARELFGKAEKDEDAGRWADALDKLRRVVTVKPTPGIRFHMALCEEKLSELVPALADYTAAEQLAREQNNKDVLDAVSEPLRVLRIRVPTLTLDVPPAEDVSVQLDGTAVASGLFGVAMPVEPGRHHVEARASGMQPFTSDVELSEREATTTKVTWVPVRTQPLAQRDPFETPPAAEAHATPVKWGAIAMTVTAAALVGFGAGAYMAADGAVAPLDAKASSLTVGCPSDPSCSGMVTTVRAWDAVALGSWIAAGAATVFAIVLWARPSHPATHARLEVRPAGLALTGSF